MTAALDREQDFDIQDLQRQARLAPEATEYADALAKAMEHDCAYVRSRSWIALRECDERSRVGHMAARYLGLVEPDEQARRNAVDTIVREELSWDEPTLRMYTLSRLRSWLLIATTAPEAARTVAASYEAVFEKLPGAMEFRRATAVQSVFTAGISSSGQQLLLELVPGMRRFVAERRPVPAPRGQEPASGSEAEPLWKRLLRRINRARAGAA